MSDYITEDHQLQILKSLPAKTLLRFRCVCKEWKQIIDSQSFMLDHLALQKPRLIAEYEADDFLVFDPSKLPYFDTLICPPVDKDPSTSSPCDSDSQSWSDEEIPPIRNHLIGTLYGVICLYDDCWRQFLLWNPSIRKFLSVSSAVDFYWVEPDSDGEDLGSCGAFWIDPSTKDFKIVVFKVHSYGDYDDYGDDDVYGLYSSKEQQWKEIPLGHIYQYDTDETTPPVVIKGVAYWIASYKFREEGQLYYGIVVLLFNFEEERFDTIDALFIEPGLNLPVLCDLEGALSLLYINRDKDCDVLLRKEDSWVHMIRISLLPSVSRILWAHLEMEEMQKNSRILATVNDELALFETKRFMCYYLKSELKNPNIFFIVNGFVESLLFPESLGWIMTKCIFVARETQKSILSTVD